MKKSILFCLAVVLVCFALSACGNSTQSSSSTSTTIPTTEADSQSGSGDPRDGTWDYDALKWYESFDENGNVQTMEYTYDECVEYLTSDDEYVKKLTTIQYNGKEYRIPYDLDIFLADDWYIATDTSETYYALRMESDKYDCSWTFRSGDVKGTAPQNENLKNGAWEYDISIMQNWDNEPVEYVYPDFAVSGLTWGDTYDDMVAIFGEPKSYDMKMAETNSYHYILKAENKFQCGVVTFHISDKRGLVRVDIDLDMHRDYRES